MNDDNIIPDSVATKPFIIYKLTLNNKVYIGYTSQTLNKRLKQHIYSARCSTPKSKLKHTLFSYAIRKYGFENIVSEVLENVIGPEEATIREEYYISLYDSTNGEFGYNMLKSGMYYDKSRHNKDFYTNESYRKKRSELVRGTKNGRYSGYTDDELVDEAIKYFQEFGNIHIHNWRKYCKLRGFPTNFETISTFRFNGGGYSEFQKRILVKLKDVGIDISYAQFTNRDFLKGVDMIEFYKRYYGYEGHIDFVSKDRAYRYHRSKLTPKLDFQIRENRIFEHTLKYFKEFNNIHEKRMCRSRKIEGLEQALKPFFGKRGMNGLRITFMQYCLQNNILLKLNQLYCMSPNSKVNNPEREKLFYDYYQKIKDETSGI